MRNSISPTDFIKEQADAGDNLCLVPNPMSATAAAAADTDYHFHYIPGEEKYQYSPLQSASHIRLLILHDLAQGLCDANEAPLTGVIIDCKIDPEVKYIALCPISDSRPATKTLETADGFIAITPALYDALFNLRRMISSAVMLWTPEICLDFESDKERQHVSRVRNLKRIYASSDQVIAYLGADDDDTGDAHDLFFKLASINMTTPPTNPEDMSRLGFPSWNHSAWVALDRFLCRPWFRSIHALPACLWAKDLQFVGEQWSLNASIFLKAAVSVAALQLPAFGQGINSDELIHGAYCFAFFARLRVQYAVLGKQLMFSELLRRCRFAEADSVLERLVILAAISDKGDDPALWADIDDVSSHTEVEDAIRIARYFLHHDDEGVKLLSLARGCAGDSDFPSWTPDGCGLRLNRRDLDWAAFQTATVDGSWRGVERDDYGQLRIVCAPLPCSCAGHNSITVVSRDIKQGAKSSALLPVLALWKHAQAMCRAMRSSNGEPFTKYPGTGEEPLEAVWETLCKSKQPQVTANQLSASMASAKAIFMALATEDVTRVVTQHHERAKDALDNFVDELAGWRFCVTRTGYMGLVPQEAEAGDLLMAIRGAAVPFVFREVQGTQTYCLVGECYLRGVMMGEVKERLKFEEKVLV